MLITALLLVSGTALGQTPGDPTWLTDYTVAQTKGAKVGRPLAVFVGKGTTGAAQVCRDGKLCKETSTILSERFVCLYVNSDAPANKWLVEAFSLSSGKGVVLSDRTGNRQTFHCDGEVSTANLLKALRDGAGIVSQPTAALMTFTSANFDAEVLKSPQPVLVDFFADWCGPCQRMLPVVTALGSEVRGIAKVGKLNTDQNRAIASEYGVSAIPAFLIFHNGRVVDRIVGATSQAELATRLTAAGK